MLEIKETFNKRLNKALEDNNMKPADLARVTGISEATISQYRSGYSKPKDKRLVQLANALHVDPSWLMGLDVPMKRPLSDVSHLDSTAQKTIEDDALLGYFHALNESGKEQALLQVQVLTQIPAYTKEGSSASTDIA